LQSATIAPMTSHWPELPTDADADGAPKPLPAPPTLRGALRASVSDFYFNSWRLVPANLLWGLGLAVVYLAFLVSWPVAALISPLLCLPVVSMHRIGGRIVRGGDVSLSDGLSAWREVGLGAVVVGAIATVTAAVMLTNVVGGIQSADIIGVAFATLAGWGLVIGWIWLCAFWPILGDPERSTNGVRANARLASYLVLAHPVRIGSLAVLLAVLYIASSVVIAAIVTVALAFGAVVGCRFVLPAADRLEAQIAQRDAPS
jgi:hypothetical protein